MGIFECPDCGNWTEIDELSGASSVYCRPCGKLHRLPAPSAVAAAAALPSEPRVTPPDDVEVTGDGLPAMQSAVTRDVPAPAVAAPEREPGPPGGEVGLEIPGFRIEGEIGRGGMGIVYAATQIALDRRVAIKVLNPELTRQSALVQRFDKEARVLARLSHPHIIQMITKGEAGGTFYFVMEFVPGSSLRRRIPPGGMRFEDASPIMEQVCEALSFIHSEGVIHRDVKPENILLSEKGGVKLGDFGLVGLLHESTFSEHLTRSATAMGTLLYMAPEQRADARSVDQRADLYSLGVTFYEMLTGRLPEVKYVPPSRLAPGLDAALDAVIDRALESSASDRFATADAMLDVLRAVPGWRGRLTPVPAARRTVTDREREEETWAAFMNRLEGNMHRPAPGTLDTITGEDRLKALWVEQKRALGQVRNAAPGAVARETAAGPGGEDPAEVRATEARMAALWKRGRSQVIGAAAGPDEPQEPLERFRSSGLIALGVAALLVLLATMALL